MQEREDNNTNEKKSKKGNFNIIVTYAKDGQSFQSIAENIIIRKINENLCLLDGLYVLEEYRNQKIASSLLNEAIDRCKKLNVKYIDINVMEKNELAKRIYKKLDFTEYEVKLRKNIVNS